MDLRSADHHVEIAYARGVLYARCDCGWEGTPRAAPPTMVIDWQDPAAAAADRDGAAHAREVTT
ncbi:MAG: hypothetical protein ACRD0K_25665 [Egibacteraceae bacterium]